MCEFHVIKNFSLNFACVRNWFVLRNLWLRSCRKNVVAVPEYEGLVKALNTKSFLRAVIDSMLRPCNKERHVVPKHMADQCPYTHDSCRTWSTLTSLMSSGTCQTQLSKCYQQLEHCVRRRSYTPRKRPSPPHRRAFRHENDESHGGHKS